MTERPLNPKKCPVAIDANALDRHDDVRARMVDRLLTLKGAGTINLIVPKGVRIEIQNPNTPSNVQEAALPQIFTMAVGLNSDEQRRKRIIEAELQGNAQPGKHTADADHLFEAGKYGGYFITYDQRIHEKAARLGNVLSPSLNVVTLERFFEIFDDYEAGRRI